MKLFLEPTKPKLISALILSVIFFQPSFLNGVFSVALTPIIAIPAMLYNNSSLAGRPGTGMFYNIGAPLLFIASNFLTWYLVACVIVYLAATQKKNR